MVRKRGKKIELRKRKDTEKEKKIKERKQKAKKFKEEFQSFELSVVIFLLIGANLIFLTSVAIHSFATSGTNEALISPPRQVGNLEATPKTLKIEVLNGCGVDGVAKRVTEFLRAKNIDIVKVGNFESRELSETIVIDRKDYELANAKIIGKIIGVDENRMFPQLSPQRQLDATIIIGKNYPDLKAFQEKGSAN